jgi:hypothetical protein
MSAQWLLYEPGGGGVHRPSNSSSRDGVFAQWLLSGLGG